MDSRSLQVHMLLGKLYTATSRKHPAAESYLRALKENPYAMEAVQALASLGAEKCKAPIAAALDAGHARREIQEENNNFALFSKEFVFMLTAKYRHQTGLAWQLAQKLSTEYPDNIHLLLAPASGTLPTEQRRSSRRILSSRSHARTLEPGNTVGMDQYANILGQAGKLHELSDLTDSMLQMDDWTTNHRSRGLV